MRLSLATTQSCAFAVGHQFAVALHGGEAARKRLGFGAARHAQGVRKFVIHHGNAPLAQRVEDLNATGNVDVADARGVDGAALHGTAIGGVGLPGFFDKKCGLS